MAEKTSYIRIDRNILRWKWWSHHNTLVVFLFLLIEANIKDNGFLGILVHRGQVVTSLPSLCKNTGLSIQSVRTAISHLKSTGEITVKTYPKFSVITIVNYDKYQDLTGKSTYNQQATNSQLTGNQQHYEKKEKKEKKEKNSRSAPMPSGQPQRGTDDFRTKSHLLLKRDEGTVDDIPTMYREMFTDFCQYWDWRNQ